MMVPLAVGSACGVSRPQKEGMKNTPLLSSTEAARGSDSWGLSNNPNSFDAQSTTMPIGHTTASIE